ncbi:hypothetical protein, partial [Porticoccus sp.]
LRSPPSTVGCELYAPLEACQSFICVNFDCLNDRWKTLKTHWLSASSRRLAIGATRWDLPGLNFKRWYQKNPNRLPGRGFGGP